MPSHTVQSPTWQLYAIFENTKLEFSGSNRQEFFVPVCQEGEEGNFKPCLIEDEGGPLEAAAKGKNVKILKCKSGHRPCNTEPKVVVRVSGRAEVAIRYPCERRKAAPATATIHPARTTVIVRIRLCRT